LLAVSSLAAFKGLPGESAYCASKAAVNAYMEGLRIALRARGVAVTTVCPGFVATAMTPMNSAAPFLMSADAAARRIARLITRRKSGVVRFPLPMALLTDLIARLPDALVARLVHVDPEQEADSLRVSEVPVPSLAGSTISDPSRPRGRGDEG